MKIIFDLKKKKGREGVDGMWMYGHECIGFNISLSSYKYQTQNKKKKRKIISLLSSPLGPSNILRPDTEDCQSLSLYIYFSLTHLSNKIFISFDLIKGSGITKEERER